MADDERGERHAGNAAITAVLQIGTMVAGGVVALLILRLFGKNARTDGLLAAYSLYGLVLVLAQTFRTTAIPRLSEDELHLTLARYLGAALVLSAAAAIPLVALAGSVTALLTGDLGAAADDAARSALTILWAAAACQLVAGVLAAALAVSGDFITPGAAYLVGTLVSVVVIPVLSGALGTDAVPVALAVGSVVTAGAMTAQLLRRGYRPRFGRSAARRRGVLWPALQALLLGSVAAVIGQVLYVVSTAFAARLGEGAVTVYSYAFFASLLLVGATAVPAQVVLAGPIARGWDRRPESLERDTLAVVRTGLILVVPALALVVALGSDGLRLLFGSALTGEDRRTIVACITVLGVTVAAGIAQTVPLLAAFARARYGMVGLVSAGAALLHLGLSAAAAQTGELVALAAATAVTNVAAVGALYALTFGGHTEAMLRRVLGEHGRMLLAALAFAAPLTLGAWVGGLVAHAAGWLAGVTLFGLALRTQPVYADLLGRLGSVWPGRARPAA